MRNVAKTGKFPRVRSRKEQLVRYKMIMIRMRTNGWRAGRVIGCFAKCRVFDPTRNKYLYGLRVGVPGLVDHCVCSLNVFENIWRYYLYFINIIEQVNLSTNFTFFSITLRGV